jgi:hypothetical protein
MGIQQIYKGNPELKQYYLVNDFTGGINTTSVDERTEDNEFRDLVNVELSKKGMIQNRKGWGEFTLLNELLAARMITLPAGPYALVKVVKNDGNLLQQLEDYEARGKTIAEFIAAPIGYTFELLLIYSEGTALKVKVLTLSNILAQNGLFPVKDSAGANFETISTNTPLSENIPYSNIETAEYTDFIYFSLSQINENLKGLVQYDIVNRVYKRISSGLEEFYRPTPYEVSKVGFNVLAPFPIQAINKQEGYFNILGMFLTKYAINGSTFVDTDIPLLSIPSNGEVSVNLLYTGDFGEDTPEEILNKIQLEFYTLKTVIVNGVPDVQEVPIEKIIDASELDGGLAKFAVRISLRATPEVYIRASIVTAFSAENVVPFRTFLTTAALNEYYNPPVPQIETTIRTGLGLPASARVRFSVPMAGDKYRIYDKPASGYSYALSLDFGITTEFFNEDTINQYINTIWQPQTADLATYQTAINSGAVQSVSYPDTVAGNAAVAAYTIDDLPDPQNYNINNWAMVFVRDANNQPIISTLKIWKTVQTTSLTYPVYSLSPTTKYVYLRSTAGSARVEQAFLTAAISSLSERVPSNTNILLAGDAEVEANYYSYNGGTANTIADFSVYNFPEISDTATYIDIYAIKNTETERKVETLDTTGFRILEIGSRLVLYKGNVIWFSDLYQFNYIPNYNYIVLPLNPDDNITSITYFKGSYMVFTKERIYKMSGTFGLADFQVQLVSDAIGCIAPFSIRSFNNTVVFLTFDGLYRIKQNYYLGGLENVEKIDKQLGKVAFPTTKVYSMLFNEQYFLFYNDGDEADFNVLKMYYNMDAPQGYPFVKDKNKVKPSFISRFEDGMYTIANNAFYKYDRGYTDLLPRGTVTEEQVGNHSYTLKVTTTNLFFNYPTHDKKIKAIFVKTNCEFIVPLYFNVYIDGRLVYTYKDFQTVRQPDGQLTYELIEDPSFYIGNVGRLNEGDEPPPAGFDLTEDKLGDTSTQVHKIVIAGKGKGITIELEQRIPEYFGIQDIGYLYKMGKAREDR